MGQMGQTSQMGKLDQPPSDSIPTSTSAGMDDGMDMSGEHHYHQQTHQQTHPHQQQLPWQRPGALTDPLFQDLDRNSRYYLAHCSWRPLPLSDRWIRH